jgi:hypothetical protein
VPAPVLQDHSGRQEHTLNPTAIYVYLVGPATTAATLALALNASDATGVQLFLDDDGRGDDIDVAKQASVASGELMQAGLDFQIVDLR